MFTLVSYAYEDELGDPPPSSFFVRSNTGKEGGNTLVVVEAASKTLQQWRQVWDTLMASAGWWQTEFSSVCISWF